MCRTCFAEGNNGKQVWLLLCAWAPIAVQIERAWTGTKSSIDRDESNRPDAIWCFLAWKIVFRKGQKILSSIWERLGRISERGISRRPVIGHAALPFVLTQLYVWILFGTSRQLANSTFCIVLPFWAIMLCEEICNSYMYIIYWMKHHWWHMFECGIAHVWIRHVTLRRVKKAASMSHMYDMSEITTPTINCLLLLVLCQWLPSGSCR